MVIRHTHWSLVGEDLGPSRTNDLAYPVQHPLFCSRVMFSLFQEPGSRCIVEKNNSNNLTGQYVSSSNVSNAAHNDHVGRIDQPGFGSVDCPPPIKKHQSTDTTRLISRSSHHSTDSSSKSDDLWCQIVMSLKAKEQIVQIVEDDAETPLCKPFGSFRDKKAKEAVVSKPDKQEQCHHHVHFGPSEETTALTISSTENRRSGLKRSKLDSLRLRKDPLLKDTYWTRHEVQRMKYRASKKAKEFRSQNRATVAQIEKLFDDFCRNNSGDNVHDVDEETEEMLTFFLRDWSSSEARGLEEMVSSHHMFREGRSLAIESILAYQQLLRSAGYTMEDMEVLLRARSESASRRHKMFSLYLALGDALVSATETADEFHF